MYLYGITFVVEPRCDADFLKWVQSALPSIAGEHAHTLYKILDERHQGHFSYSVQVQTPDIAAYTATKAALEGAAEEIQQKFGEEGVLFFATLLKEIDL